MKKEWYNILSERNYQDREHQRRNVLDYVKPSKPHVIAAATSAGKTILTAGKFELYYRCGILKKNQKVLILASDKTILRRNFTEQFDNFFKNGKKSFTYAAIENKSQLEKAIEDKVQVLIGLPQTIIKNYKIIGNIEWLVVDEAHRWYFAKTIKDIIKKTEPNYQLLLTGTPFKFNLRRDDYIIDYTSVRTLYEQKLISDVQLQVLHSSVQLTNIDYVKLLGNLKDTVNISKNVLNDSFSEVIKQLIQILKLPNKSWNSFNNISKNFISVFGKLEKSIIFANGIDEADCMYEILKKYKVKSLISHSEDDNNAEETFNEFKINKDIKVLITVNRGKEGFDFDELYNIIDFSFTQEFSVVMQMIGRLMRKPKKPHNKVFYKVAPRNTSQYFSDWMDCLIQLFDDEWYKLYDTRNAKQIRVPNELLNRNINRTNNTRNSNGQIRPKNLSNIGMNSISFMNQNKWFKSNDKLSVVSYTTLEDIFRKYKLIQSKKFVNFDECKKYAQSLKLTGAKQYLKMKHPENIPQKPYNTYKEEWKGWGDYLGTGTIATYNIEYRNVQDAKKFVHKLKLKSRKEWEEYCKSGKKPSDIPNAFNVVYKGLSTGEWLGTNIIATNDRVYLDYNKAQKMVSKMGFKNNKEYKKAYEDGLIPNNIPKTADKSYIKKGTWKGWSHFLGHNKYIH